MAAPAAPAPAAQGHGRDVTTGRVPDGVWGVGGNPRAGGGCPGMRRRSEEGVVDACKSRTIVTTFVASEASSEAREYVLWLRGHCKSLYFFL